MLPKKIGDDYLQHKAHGHAVPDSFTHGTSAQRKTGFIKALKQVMCINVIPFLQTKFNLSSDIIRRNLYAPA